LSQVETKEIVIPYSPHDAQREFHDHPARFKVLAWGTKAGKTVAAVNEAIRFALLNPNSLVWWVAPVFEQTKIGWEYIPDFLPSELIAKINNVDYIVYLKNKSRITFKTADAPDHLTGRGIHLIVVDEAAKVKAASWYALRSTLIKTGGKAVFISTPKGHNWFYKVWRQGLDPYDPIKNPYKSFHAPSTINPHLSKEEFEQLKKDLPQWIYERDVLAQFKENIGTAFTNASIEACKKGNSLGTPQPHERYVIGVDLAKTHDYAVDIIMDSSGHVCGIKRWQADWNIQIDDLKALSQYWNNALIGIDSRGPGSPVFDELISEGVSVDGYDAKSNTRKNELIHKLMLCLEQVEISYPECDETRILIEELKSFSYKQTEGGTTTYQAPSGLTDDCVIALALAAWFNQQSTPWDAIVAV